MSMENNDKNCKRKLRKKTKNKKQENPFLLQNLLNGGL